MIDKGRIRVKKMTYISFVFVVSVSLLGCQKSDFYTEDFTATLGNTSENVHQGGLMASTDEYLYLPLEDGVVEISKNNGKSIVIQEIAAEFGYVNVVDGYLYYNAFSSDENKRGLVVRSLDGKFLRQISKTSYYPFVVAEDWIYATNLRGGTLYKINIKNSELTMLAEQPVEEFSLHDNGIFYHDGDHLYSMDLNGENKQKLLSDIQVKSLSYRKKNNTLIFINSAEDNQIYSYHIDTNQLSVIKEGDYSFVQVFGDDEIVTLHRDGLLQSFSLLDGHVGIEISGVANFQIFGHTLYYFDHFKSVYSITEKNQKPTLVFPLEK